MIKGLLLTTYVKASKQSKIYKLNCYRATCIYTAKASANYMDHQRVQRIKNHLLHKLLHGSKVQQRWVSFACMQTDRSAHSAALGANICAFLFPTAFSTKT